MQIKLHPEMHNTYTLRLINDLTGELKQEVKVNNIIVNNFWFWTFNTSHWNPWIAGVSFGSGEGTPQPSDKNMFNGLWSYGDNYGRNFLCTKVKREDNAIVRRFKMTIPATSSYVGNITEIGIYGYFYNNAPGMDLLTHAMLKDAEGNNISINKTDIDKLEVEVELRVSGYEDTTSGFECPSENGYLLSAGVGSAGTIASYPKDIMGILSYYRNNYSGVQWFTAGNASYDHSALKFVASGYRLGTGDFNGHYLNAIEINSIGRFKLPNSNLMPPVEVKGVSVGTGDGTTTDFEPPVDLFIKDTDKIYVDGVLKTRDVDYTIDNKSNRHLLHEITPGNFMKEVTGGIVKAISSKSCAPFAPIVINNSPEAPMGDVFHNNTGSQAISCLVLDGDNPIVIELAEDPTIGLDVNRCKFRYFYIMGQYGSSSFTDVDLVLAYSKDGITFVEVGRADLTGYSYGNELNLEFATVKAKYWRLSLDFSRAAEAEQEKKTTHYLSFKDEANGITSKMSMLYYYGEPIKFTNPPAEGAIITMDCTLDRPYKTENWVIDFNYEIQA